MAPLISVILPVKNGEAYLAQAVESVLGQTFGDFELLIVDDGSVDGTVALLAAFQKADRRVRVLANPGAGLVDALNHGAAASSAGLIARMDADDVCLPERFVRQYEFLKVHEEVAVVGSQVSFIDGSGAPTGKSTKLPETPRAIAKSLLKFCCLRHPSVIMRREALVKTGGYRRQFPVAEDYDLWLRMAERYPLVNLPETLLRYRLHGGQVSEDGNWTQRLSRNLALLSARERRRGSPDPMESHECFPPQARGHGCEGRRCHQDVCRTVRAFTVAEALARARETRADPVLSRDDGRLLLRYLMANTIGDGQNRRLRALIGLCRAAFRSRAPVLSALALGVALWVHPGRAVRFLAEEFQ